MKHSAFKLWLSYALAAWFFRHTSRRSIRTRVLTRQNSSTLSPFLTFLKEVAERLKCKSICKRRRCDERSSSVTSSPQLIKCNQTPNRLNMFHSNQNSDADCQAEYQLNRHFKEKHDHTPQTKSKDPTLIPRKQRLCSTTEGSHLLSKYQTRSMKSIPHRPDTSSERPQLQAFIFLQNTVTKVNIALKSA